MTNAALAASPRRDYADFIAATFERVLAEQVPALREPVAARPERALKIVGLVVETIAGLAVGVVAGEVERATRLWFGANAAAEILDRFTAPLGSRIDQPPRFLADADARPLVDELGARLRPRMRHTAADIARIVARMPAEYDAMCAQLRETSLLDERLRDELATGWACACAAIEGPPLPAIQSARSRALWQKWSRLAGLERRVSEPYIAVIRE